MSQPASQRYHAIPTHVFTGFLGVGKTSLIKRFLQEKPARERWAVLVNEFGEVGIDGALLQTDAIAVSEVPGGCMCCSVGVPSRAALNNLIRSQNPDRIIIEPTGLANPQQILAMLSGPEYAEVLDIRAVLCLVDPWCFSEPKFLQLPDFHQQLQTADIVAATKLDLATPEQLQQFYDYGKTQLPATTRVTALPAKLPWEWLAFSRSSSLASVADLPRRHHSVKQGHYHEHETNAEPQSPTASSALALGADGTVRKENQAEFGYSCGWIFDKQWIFSLEKLQTFLEQLPVPRVKGVLQTDRGWCSVNRMRNTLSVAAFDNTLNESRIEMITLEKPDWLQLEQQLRDCRSDNFAGDVAAT